MTVAADPPRDILDLTLAAAKVHGWRLVLLRGKKPASGRNESWPLTTDAAVVRQHVKRTGNVGLVCGAVSGVAVLDFDDLAAFDALCVDLGPLRPVVLSGSGKYHCYIAYEDGLPAKLRYEGAVVGEIQRGPGLQQVVLPPSFHPDTHRQYRWLVDPREPLPVLPETWRQYIRTIPEAHQPVNAWDGPPPDDLIARALKQPGAKRRTDGIKFQCPACRDEGHDKH